MLPILKEDAPILMFWMVHDPSKLQNNQLPLPNNQRYPYKQRLLNWATKEPQRKIKLYYISIGLNTQQIKMLHDLSNPDRGGKSNIEIIDFMKKFAHKYNTLYFYDTRVLFTWKIDISRLIMLMEEGPAIYFDFDILPTQQKIGEITLNNNIGFAMGEHINCKTWLDISILVSTTKNNPTIQAAYKAVSYFIKKYLDKENKSIIYTLSKKLYAQEFIIHELVWTTCMLTSALKCNKLQKYNKEIKILQYSKKSLYKKIINILKTKKNIDNALSIYNTDYSTIIIQEFRVCGNFTITQDLTWLNQILNIKLNIYDINNNNIENNNAEQHTTTNKLSINLPTNSTSSPSPPTYFRTCLSLHVNAQSQILLQ
ncbi:hypothetical protein [Candidatus Neoehrlichia procyonis]|uniref:Uncharacterized protein n=1 Tax=Candidatus Neoehrlichia procyonis str. RAC413 TaxID=1359163 RepID=A0A0F3NPU4_9RICK|nr:hypothetical protein [Candidatus Neoehrlichia lotoris]KJV68944.1 hypothetical protein NLO413_0316 [Candidatus Neoehrlichia lotoris str. RAC413]